MNENVKQVFDYLDEAKRIYFNIAVIMANNTDIDWNDIFYKSRKNMTLLLTEGEIEDIRHIAGMLSKPRTTLDETLKKYKYIRRTIWWNRNSIYEYKCKYVFNK